MGVVVWLVLELILNVFMAASETGIDWRWLLGIGVTLLAATGIGFLVSPTALGPAFGCLFVLFWLVLVLMGLLGGRNSREISD